MLVIRKVLHIRRPHAGKKGERDDKFSGKPATRQGRRVRRFLAGSWTASILSPEAIEELYQYQEHRQKEETPQQEYEYKGSRHFPF